MVRAGRVGNVGTTNRGSPREVSPLLGRRIAIAIGAVIVSVVLMGGRLWYLQIVQGEQMRGLSEHNRIRMRRLPSPLHPQHSRRSPHPLASHHNSPRLHSQRAWESGESLPAKLCRNSRLPLPCRIRRSRCKLPSAAGPVERRQPRRCRLPERQRQIAPAHIRLPAGMSALARSFSRRQRSSPLPDVRARDVREAGRSRSCARSDR